MDASKYDDNHDPAVARQIVEFIRANNVTTAMVGDAIGKRLCNFHNFKRLGRHGVHCGMSRFVVGVGDSNYEIHRAIRFVSPREMVVVISYPSTRMAKVGELVCRYAVEVRGAEGIIVVGAVRDVADLGDIPFWAADENPIGCYNTDTGPVPDEGRHCGSSIVVADEAGVLIFMEDQISDASLLALRQIVVKEKIWFYCMRELEWSTYDIVCEKRWEADLSVLPSELREEWEAVR